MRSQHRAPREASERPRRRLPGLQSLLILLALIVPTLVLFAVVRAGVQEDERSLLQSRSADAAKLAETYSERFFESLTRAQLVDRATRGRPAEFAARMRPEATDTLSISLALVRLGSDGRARVLVNVTDRAPTLIGRLRGEAERFRAAARIGAARSAVAARGPRGAVLGWVAPGGDADHVLYAEVDLASSVTQTFAEETKVAGAIYLGGVESPLTLLGSNATLPIPSPRHTRRVNFAGASGLLVIHAREPLGGRWAQLVPWIILAFGIAMAIGVTATIAWIRRTRDELAYRATHDELTGLASRALFGERLERAITRAGGAPGVGVAVVDLDDFKLVNDSLGHAAGDDLLIEASRRLRTVMPSGGLCARLGGDEFAVLLDDGEADPARIAGLLHEALGAPFALATREATLQASVGIAYARPADSPADVVRNADIAMYRAKRSDRAPRWEVFTDEMLTEATERLRQVEELREAVRMEAFELHYQPIVDLPGHAITAVEALVRWRHPEDGVLLPAAFIALAEETGMIVEIGRWVVREACRQAAAWRQLGPGLVMSINVSGRQLLEDDFADTVIASLAVNDLPASALTIEITESYLLSDGAATGGLQRLSDLGVQIAVDDFGSGFASIGYLRRFPIRALKIDSGFVPTAPTESDREILAAIVQMATTLGLPTVGEGIENAAQLEMVTVAGCSGAQGFLFASPAPAEAITATIAAAPGSTTSPELRELVAPRPVDGA